MGVKFIIINFSSIFIAGLVGFGLCTNFYIQILIITISYILVFIIILTIVNYKEKTIKVNNICRKFKYE